MRELLIKRYRQHLDSPDETCNDTTCNLVFENSECWSVADTASYLKVSTRTVERMLTKNVFVGRKLGRRWIIPRLNVEKWLLEGNTNL